MCFCQISSIKNEEGKQFLLQNQDEFSKWRLWSFPSRVGKEPRPLGAAAAGHLLRAHPAVGALAAGSPSHRGVAKRIACRPLLGVCEVRLRSPEAQLKQRCRRAGRAWERLSRSGPLTSELLGFGLATVCKIRVFLSNVAGVLVVSVNKGRKGEGRQATK